MAITKKISSFRKRAGAAVKNKFGKTEEERFAAAQKKFLKDAKKKMKYHDPHPSQPARLQAGDRTWAYAE